MAQTQLSTTQENVITSCEDDQLLPSCSSSLASFEPQASPRSYSQYTSRNNFNFDSSEPDNVTFSSTSPTSSAHSSLPRCFNPSLEQSAGASDINFLDPPKCQRSTKVQLSTDIMSTSLIHIYKPTILNGKLNVFDADEKNLLYTAKKNKASSTPAMDIYRGENLIMPIGSVAIPKARHYPKYVNMQMSSRSVELTNDTPSSYCIHSFVSESGTLIWKSRDDGFKDCGAVHGEHGLVLMSERNIQLAEFHPNSINTVFSNGNHSTPTCYWPAGGLVSSFF